MVALEAFLAAGGTQIENQSPDTRLSKSRFPRSQLTGRACADGINSQVSDCRLRTGDDDSIFFRLLLRAFHRLEHHGQTHQMESARLLGVRLTDLNCELGSLGAAQLV